MDFTPQLYGIWSLIKLSIIFVLLMGVWFIYMKLAYKDPESCNYIYANIVNMIFNNGLNLGSRGTLLVISKQGISLIVIASSIA